MAKLRAEKKDRYFQLHHYMLKTGAWKALSAPARAVYIQIGSRYDGFNNGKIALSVRDAANECDMASNTANRAFHELVERGFIEETRHGGLSRKTRIASEWRLTAYKCDLTGALKTCAFMHRGGPAYSSYTPLKRGPSPVSINSRSLSQTTASPVSNNSRECLKILYSLSQSIHADPPECLKQPPVLAVFGGPPVSNNYTHIVYQSQRSVEPHPHPAPAIITSPPAKLPWTKPVVRELFGDEARVRRAQARKRNHD
jgi:hypothetical protein